MIKKTSGRVFSKSEQDSAISWKITDSFHHGFILNLFARLQAYEAKSATFGHLQAMFQIDAVYVSFSSTKDHGLQFNRFFLFSKLTSSLGFFL